MPHLPDYESSVYSPPLADWEIELLGGDPKDPLSRAEFMYQWKEFSD